MVWRRSPSGQWSSHSPVRKPTRRQVWVLAMPTMRTRLFVVAELRPGELLHQFFERANAARERHEAVRKVEHQHLALVKPVGHVALADIAERVFELQERGRNDPCYVSAVIAHRAGHGSHQAVAAAAVDEAEPRFRHVTAEPCGCGFEAWAAPSPRAAIDTKALLAGSTVLRAT